MLILATFGQLHADEAPFTYHIGMHFGKNYADSNSKMRDNALYGIRTTVMLTPFYGLSVGYDRMESIDIKESSDTIDAQRYYMQIEVDGEEQYHTVPYITLGVGYEDLSKDVYVQNLTTGVSQKYDVSQLYLSGGLGFRYNFIPELSLYAEGNALYKTDTTDVDYTLQAGLLYHLNATTCDDTYITQRLHDKPQEHTVLHTGAVNNLSGWKKPIVQRVKSAKKVQKSYQKKRASKAAPGKVAAKTDRRVITATKTSSSVRKVEKAAKAGGGYYVVLGAYKTEKGLHSQIKKLERAHVSYLLRESAHKGLTYVMSGAYPSVIQAKRALRKLRKIQKDAYIAKMK